MICNKDTGPQRNKKVLKETQTLETEKIKSTLTATAEAVINQYISKALTSKWQNRGKLQKLSRYWT